MLFYLREYQKRPKRLADRLVWAGLVAEGVVEQKEGLLQKTIEFRGPDLESSTDEGLVSEMAKLNNALKRLGSGWSIFVEAQRRRARAYPVIETSIHDPHVFEKLGFSCRVRSSMAA